MVAAVHCLSPPAFIWETHMLDSPSLWDFCKLTPAGTLIGRAVSPVSPRQGSNVHSDFLLKKLSLALSFFSVVLCIWTAGDYSQKEGISNTQLSHLQHIFILHPSCTLSLHYLHGISKWKGLEMSLAGPDTEAGLFYLGCSNSVVQHWQPATETKKWGVLFPNEFPRVPSIRGVVFWPFAGFIKAPITFPEKTILETDGSKWKIYACNATWPKMSSPERSLLCTTVCD